MFRGAARFFESLRILEHKPKSAKRLKEEEAFGKYGRATRTVEHALRAHSSMIITQDEVGRLRAVPGNSI